MAIGLPLDWHVSKLMAYGSILNFRLTGMSYCPYGAKNDFDQIVKANLACKTGPIVYFMYCTMPYVTLIAIYCGLCGAKNCQKQF